MAKRKKRAATSRSSRKKRRPVKRSPLQNRGRPQSVVLLQSGEQQGSAEQCQTSAGCQAPTDC